MALITISRMYGSGGSEVAKHVADALGWQLLDNEIIDAVAEQLGISPAEVAEREERVPSLVQRLAATLAMSAPEILPSPVSPTLPPNEEQLIEVTERIITEAAARGHTVVVGRGAQAVLAARPDAFHVFCYAPRPALIAYTRQRFGVSEREAAHLVDTNNRHREQYVRKYWKRSWSSAENYHLCLNTQWLGIDGAAAIVIRMAQERFNANVVSAR